MKKRIEEKRKHVNVSATLLADARSWYMSQVAAIAEQLAPRFKAREFDNTACTRADFEESHYLYQDLEEWCGAHELSANDETARIVLAVSKYAADAPSTSTPPADRMWARYSSHCLARDVHDFAIAKGWARSLLERDFDATATRLAVEIAAEQQLTQEPDDSNVIRLLPRGRSGPRDPA